MRRFPNTLSYPAKNLDKDRLAALPRHIRQMPVHAAAHDGCARLLRLAAETSHQIGRPLPRMVTPETANGPGMRRVPIMTTELAQRLTYTIDAYSLGEGVSWGSIAGKSAEIDMDTSTGLIEYLPGPADLLVSAFAACILKNVERFSKLLPFHYQSASVRVSAERVDNPPRMTAIRYELAVVTDEPQRRLDLLHRNIARHGTIFNTLSNACEVTGTITALAPDRPMTAG
jgi:uncharacterized OsmC-like protein